jgi:hypothetical protein
MHLGGVAPEPGCLRHERCPAREWHVWIIVIKVKKRELRQIGPARNGVFRV